MPGQTLDYIFRTIGAAETRDQINSVSGALARNGEVSAASTEKTAGSLALMRKGLSGVAGAVGAFGIAFGGVKAVQAGIEMQAYQEKLQAAAKAADLSTGSFERLDQAAVQSSERGGFDTNAERQGLTQLVAASKNATVAIKGNAAAVDLARGTSLGYSQAVNLVSNALDGTATRLKKYVGYVAPVKTAEQNLTNTYREQAAVIQNSVTNAQQKRLDLLNLSETVDSAAARQAAVHADQIATAQEYVAAIQRRYGSQTTAYAKSTQGQLSDLGHTFTEDMAGIGKDLLPVVDDALGFTKVLLGSKPVVEGLAGAIATLSVVMAGRFAVSAVGSAVSSVMRARAAVRGLMGATKDLDTTIKANSQLTRDNNSLKKTASLYTVDASGKLRTYRGQIDSAATATKLQSGEVMNYSQALEKQQAILQETNATLRAQSAALYGVSAADDAAAASSDGFSVAATVAAARSGVATIATDAWAASTGMLAAALDAIPGMALITGISIGLTELMEHWKAVWGAMKTAASDVWTFLKEHWKYALFATPLAPLMLVITHLKQIIGLAKSVGHFLGGIGGGIGHFVGSIFNEGGMVGHKPPKYLAVGGPIGTDTVPAWLTPGEGVLSRQAMNVIGQRGLGLLNQGTNPFGQQSITITPSPVTIEIDSKAIARAVIQYTLNKAARGPSSLVGGALVTGT